MYNRRSKAVTVTKEALNSVMKAELQGEAFEQFKSLSAKKDETQLQFNTVSEQRKAGKKGFRIIGVIYNTLTTPHIKIGYILFNDEKQSHCPYNVEQVKSIIEMHGLVNAVLENNEVKLTDGAESAFMSFDQSSVPFGDNIIYVLSRSTETVRANGQSRTQEAITFVNNRFEVQKIPAQTLIAGKNAGKINISNMKVVNKDNTTFLEAKNVDTIPTYEKEIQPEKVATSDAETFRKQQLKLKNHASFTQRLYNMFDNCIVIVNSKKMAYSTTTIRVPGISTLSRGLNCVGTKGLTAIIEKEVIPMMIAKNPWLNFEKALREVHSDICSPIGRSLTVADLMKKLLGPSVQENLKDTTKRLLYKYIWAFRLVEGLYKTINTYDILMLFNSTVKDATGLFVTSNYYLDRTIKNYCTTSKDKDYRVASYEDFNKAKYGTYLDLRHKPDITHIICNGITRTDCKGVNYIIWPVLFDNPDTVFRKLSAQPTEIRKYEPLILHILCEAAYAERCRTLEERNYRIHRTTCMLGALLGTYSLSLTEEQFADVCEMLHDLLSTCTSVKRYYLELCTPDFLEQFTYNYRISVESKKSPAERLQNVFLDYAKGAGLYTPYYSALQIPADNPYTMNWQFILTGLRNSRHNKVMLRKFNNPEVLVNQNYGMCAILAKTFNNLGYNVSYDISTEWSNHYFLLKRQLEKEVLTGKSTKRTTVHPQACVAQYLGRMYRPSGRYVNASLLRLVLYVNTKSPLQTSKTHNLY